MRNHPAHVVRDEFDAWKALEHPAVYQPRHREGRVERPGEEAIEHVFFDPRVVVRWLSMNPYRKVERRLPLVERPHRLVIEGLAFDVREDEHTLQAELSVDSLELFHHHSFDNRPHA